MVEVLFHGKEHIKKKSHSQPGHGFSGEELQLVMVQTEPGECDESGKGFSVQVVQIVVAQTKPFYVLQALSAHRIFLSLFCWGFFF